EVPHVLSVNLLTIEASTVYAAPSSYQIEMSHSDAPKLPPLADCLMSTILIRGFSVSQALIWSSKSRAFLPPPPKGLFSQKSLTFRRNLPPQTTCQVLLPVVNVSLLPNGSFTDISRVPQGIASIPGRAYL